MRGRKGFGVLLGSVVALGCGDEVPARFQEPKHALTLLHTSDIHSRVWPFRSRISAFESRLGFGPEGTLTELGGAARLATLLRRERARADCAWLDSGDALEGAGVFRRYGGRVELELLSRLGLDALALGNHELSLVGAALAALFAQFPQISLLSANLLPREGSALGPLLAPAKLVSVGGLRIAVVGVSNPASPPGLGEATNPWSLDVYPLAHAVQRAIDEIAPRADLVVVVSHLGLDGDRELVRATHGVDLVLGGHQHLVTAEPEWEDECCAQRAVPIVHSGAYGKLVSRLELQLVVGGEQEGLEIESVQLAQLALGPEVPEDAAVAHSLEPYRGERVPPLAFLLEAAWRNSALGGDSVLGDWVTDAWRRESGADVVLLNSSGLRADLEAGLLLRSDLELALPFDEPWLLTLATGGELRRGLERAARRSSQRDCTSVLQVSGLELEIACSACASAADGCLRVRRVTPFGRLPLRDDELLLVALPEYLARSGTDFEELARGLVERLDVAPSVVLERQLTKPRLGVVADACAPEMQGLSGERCRQSFAPEGCPPSAARAAELCADLPRVTGGRDGRIQMAP